MICRVSTVGSDSSLDLARKISCVPHHLSEMLGLTRSPDSELIGLIEGAYLAGQIVSQRADLACLWLLGQSAQRIAENGVGD